MQKVKIPTDFVNTNTARHTLAIERNIQLTSEQNLRNLWITQTIFQSLDPDSPLPTYHRLNRTLQFRNLA